MKRTQNDTLLIRNPSDGSESELEKDRPRLNYPNSDNPAKPFELSKDELAAIYACVLYRMNKIFPPTFDDDRIFYHLLLKIREKILSKIMK